MDIKIELCFKLLSTNSAAVNNTIDILLAGGAAKILVHLPGCVFYSLISR